MLSSGDFTDVLTEVGYHLDFAEQDKELAEQIVADKKVLDVLHQNVEIARKQTAELHELAAKSKAQLDGQLKDLDAARKQLAALEAETAKLLKQQQAAYAKLAADKTRLAATPSGGGGCRAEARGADRPARRGGPGEGRHPSIYNGTLSWPMSGRITQEFGCTSFYLRPYSASCVGRGGHLHTGIDIANSMYTPIRRGRPRQGHLGRQEPVLLGLDGDHRPLVAPRDLVFPRGQPEPQAGRQGRPVRRQGSGHRVRGHDRHDHRAAPPLVRPARRQLDKPALFLPR
jgi:hypothetical protein